MILAFIALIFATAASLAPPPLAKFAIDEGITPKDLGMLNLAVVLFLVSALVYWGASYAQTYLVGWVGQRALQDLRIQLFAHLQTLSVGFYSRRQAGAIISRLTNDVQALDQLVSDGVVTLFGSSLTLIGTAAILFWLDAELALLTLLIFPVLGIASFAFRIISADAYRITREKIAAITGYLQETLSGIRVVRAFAQEPRHKQVFADLNEENRKANMTTVYLNAAYFPGVELLSALVTAGILFYGGVQAIQGEVTIGVLVAFVAALNNFFDPIQQLSQLYTTYQAGMAALDKIFELLDQEPDILDGELELESLRGEIEFDDVVFSYGSEDSGDALCHITLHVPPGQTVALVGATGAGKSTLAKLVARFYDPTSGRILVDGHDLREVSASSLRSQMGIVPQEAFLFSGTIGDNIAFGRVDATPEEVEQAARAVGAHEFIVALERGYDTEVGERGAQLSAGQRQLDRLRPRADRRPAHPRARRGDVERRHPHRDPDRERAAAPARRPHRDRHRPPPLHDPGRGPHRRPRPRADRRAGHARGAARRAGRLLQALPGLGGAGRGLAGRGPVGLEVGELRDPERGRRVALHHEEVLVLRRRGAQRPPADPAQQRAQAALAAAARGTRAASRSSRATCRSCRRAGR